MSRSSNHFGKTELKREERWLSVGNLMESDQSCRARKSYRHLVLARLAVAAFFLLPLPCLAGYWRLANDYEMVVRFGQPKLALIQLIGKSAAYCLFCFLVSDSKSSVFLKVSLLAWYLVAFGVCLFFLAMGTVAFP